MVDVDEHHDLDDGASVSSTNGAASPGASRRNAVLAAGFVAGGLVLLVLFYLASWHIVTISPDGSTVLL